MRLNKLITQTGKRIIHLWIKLQIETEFRERFKEFFDNHPEYKKSVDRKTEKEHINLWKPVGSNINLDTLRLCCNLSKKNNPKIVPEELFASDIQPILCQKQKKIEYLGNKSFYNRWFEKGIFPADYAHNIQGLFYDSDYNIISKEKFKNILKNLNYPVVFKPNIDSFGGEDIFFPQDYMELIRIAERNSNFVIQEFITQNKFFSTIYNNKGINTVRVNLYRSVITNKMDIINASIRMGRDNSLDNLTSGGLICSVDSNGKLNDYAVDKFGDKYFQHPNSKISFGDMAKIPKYDEMKELSLKVGSDLYLTRLASLDLCLDSNSNWRVVEINLFDIALRAAQLGGVPFFGKYTNEVIDYCKNHPWWKMK